MRTQDIRGISPAGWHYDTMDQLKQLVYGRSEEAFAAGDAARDAIMEVEALEKRKAFMRSRFIESMGGLPDSRTALNARVTGTIRENGFRIEKVIFESRPNVFVTANLYIPDGVKAPRGAVLFLSGHHLQAKHQDEYQIVCQYLVSAGLVVLAQDPVGQGERFSYYEDSIKDTTISWGTGEHDYAGCQCWPLGDGIARYFVHDAMRGIDYLCTRPEVDPGKIGVTGNSGGGTQTSLVMMCDPRIAAAAPATFIMNRHTYMHAGGGQDAEQIWTGMTALGFDHEDILLAAAPKPVLVLAVKYDFFPIEGTGRSVDRVRRFWEMYGKSENIELFMDDTTHKYTRSMAKKAAEFFSLHLLGNQVTPEDEKIEPIDPTLLWCTASGQVRGELEGARFVHEENCMRLLELEACRSAMPEPERKARAIEWLKEKVFSFRRSCDLNPRYYMTQQVEEMQVQMCIWWSQEGIFNHAFMFRNFERIGKDIPVTIAVWNGGTCEVQSHIEWIRRKCSSGRAVMVLDVSGAGALLPNSLSSSRDLLDFRGVVSKLTHDLMWLDDSLAAMRTYDVIRALDMVQQWPGIQKTGVELYANGRQGVYAQLAAFLDRRIKNIEVVNGMGSYTGWVKERYYDSYDIMSVILPGVLQYFDLPDMEKWRADSMQGEEI